MLTTSSVVHGGNLHWAATTYNIPAQDFLDFSANINFLGPPPGFHQAIEQGLKQVGHYPDPNCTILNHLIANAFGVNEGQVRVGNGGIELIYAFFRSRKPARVLIVTPTFGEYQRAAVIAGHKVEPYQLSAANSWSFCVEQLGEAINKVDMVVLCNPNNPTGNLIPGATMRQLIDIAKDANTLIIVDEAFLDFVEDFNQHSHSMVGYGIDSGNVVVFKSFTKFFAIPGLRLGCCIAPEHYIKELALWQEPWTVNCIAAAVGELLVSPEIKAWRDYVRGYHHQVREKFINNLQELCGLTSSKSVANFLLVDIAPLGCTSLQLRDILAPQGLLVRQCESFPGMPNNYIRVAVRHPDDNSKLIGVLTKGA